MKNEKEAGEISIEDHADEKSMPLAPAMNISVPTVQEKSDNTNLVTDSQLLGIYDEIINDIRKDKVQIDSVLDNFIDMVVNDGDASTSSKEALVNLIKIKTDQSDKMAKIADLMTRVKLRDRDTFPRYLASQTNVNIGDSTQKRTLLEAIKKRTAKVQQENENEK